MRDGRGQIKLTDLSIPLTGLALNETVCLGCGCTYDDACIDDAGRTCSWAVVHGGIGLCSFCVSRPIAELASSLDARLEPAKAELRRDGFLR